MGTTTYTIQMASKISGVGVHTIRAWEKRYKALEPSRDASGHRSYSKSDVEKLMLLSELCLLGYSISKVAGLSIVELKENLKDLGKSAESLEEHDFNLINDTKLTIDPTQSLPILNFALKSYNLDVISVELAKLKVLLSAKEFSLEILMPIVNLLAELQISGALSSDQEKAVRGILRFHMGYSLYHPVEKKEKSSVNIVVCGMEGDLNDLGLGAVGLLCSYYGFHFTYLGADITYEALSDVAKSLACNVILLGPTNSYNQMGQAHFQNYIEKLFFKLTSEVELVVVGKSELDLSKFPPKRLLLLKNLNAVDEYLSQKK